MPSPSTSMKNTVRFFSNKGAIDYLREFVRKHVKANDVIITFNYDCLIERVLHEAGLWTVLDGYGFPRVLKSSKGGPPEPPSSVKVLKLHGSLGWISGVLKDQDILFIQNKALGFAGYTQSEDSGYQRGV